MTIHGANGYTVSGQAIYQYPMRYPYSYPTSTDKDFVEAQSDYLLVPHLLGLIGTEYENERGYSGGSSNFVERRNSNYTLLFQGDFWDRLFYTSGTGVVDDQLFGAVPWRTKSSCFAPLKVEQLHVEHFRTVRQAKDAV